jgi:hypothetical protein
MKSEGVKDVVRWMEGEIKKAKGELDEANKNHSLIPAVGEFYDTQRREAEIRLRTMVSWKISTEKYMKKLRHQGE